MSQYNEVTLWSPALLGEKPQNHSLMPLYPPNSSLRTVVNSLCLFLRSLTSQEQFQTSVTTLLQITKRPLQRPLGWTLCYRISLQQTSLSVSRRRCLLFISITSPSHTLGLKVNSWSFNFAIRPFIFQWRSCSVHWSSPIAQLPIKQLFERSEDTFQKSVTPSTTWVLGIDLKSWGLVLSTFTYLSSRLNCYVRVPHVCSGCGDRKRELESL